ncbi:hypothetical protein K1719_046832 [Acacia pycnantha]|nr:hypothetical protein K1719_046832 [Acacia pycnantha]
MTVKTMELEKGGGVTGKEIMEVLATVAAELGDEAEEVEETMQESAGEAVRKRSGNILQPRRRGQNVSVRGRARPGPRLLARFAAGRVEEFLHATTLSAADIRDPEISALIASKMREFHKLHMPGDKKVQIWHKLRKWLNLAKSLSSSKDAKNFGLQDMDEEINKLENLISGSEGCHQEIGFCHNDLQYGNIMMDKDTRSITIIDYEYASYNPIAYDLANHFCEMAADYQTDTPHLLDYTKYPDFEERQRFVKIYLSAEGKKPSNAEVEQLMNDAEKYTLANHLFWGLWGLISSYVNKIDFDYKEYARQRFQQYWLKKLTLLDW